jgi:hypothetical protein
MKVGMVTQNLSYIQVTVLFVPHNPKYKHGECENATSIFAFIDSNK